MRIRKITHLFLATCCDASAQRNQPWMKELKVSEN
jgi:hypothetical protein